MQYFFLTGRKTTYIPSNNAKSVQWSWWEANMDWKGFVGRLRVLYLPGNMTFGSFWKGNLGFIVDDFSTLSLQWALCAWHSNSGCMRRSCGVKLVGRGWFRLVLSDATRLVYIIHKAYMWYSDTIKALLFRSKVEQCHWLFSSGYFAPPTPHMSPHLSIPT